MAETNSIENMQTGWVIWHYVRIVVEDSSLLTCQASVTNTSPHNPLCIVNVAVAGRPQHKVEFRFWIQPNRSEVVQLARRLTGPEVRVVSIDVDEE